MPTPSPGWKRVPRWRTMISPPVTVSPAKTFTPRRLALESRPLRLEPRPFLCAIADLRDLDARQILAVAAATLVAALRLELEDAQLLAARVGDHARGHRHLAQAVGVEHRVLRAEEHGLELHRGTLVDGELLDEQRLPALDAVLLASGLDDCVHANPKTPTWRSRPWHGNGAVRPC